MNKPYRVRRSRSKGWRMPENTAYVGRPTKWGNPFHVFNKYNPDDWEIAVDMYRDWLNLMIAKGELDPSELKGKNLACWCNLDQPCHADVLLELANRTGKANK